MCLGPFNQCQRASLCNIRPYIRTYTPFPETQVPSPSSRPASLVESPASASQETTEMSTSSSSVLPPVTNVLVTQDGCVPFAPLALLKPSARSHQALIQVPLPHSLPLCGISFRDTLAKCDLTGSTDSLVIREKIYSKLRIADAEQDRCSIHRGRFQAGQEGPPLTDQDLWDLCKDIAPSSSSPPLLFVSITGPTLGTAPLAPQNSAMYGIENKVASLAAEEEQQQQQQASNSGHALRSSNPKWHKSRASDPDSSPRSPPLPQGAQFVSTPSSRSGGGASSRNDFFLRPTSPPNGTDEPFIPFATQGGEGRRASSESSRSNPSAGRLPVGAVDARRAPVEAFNDPNYQEWIDHSRSADRPGVSSSASSSSRQDPARQGPYSHAPSTSSSGVAPPPPRHIQHWESQAHSQSQPSSSSQRLRKTSLDEQAHLRQAASRQEWDPQRPPSHPKSKSSTGYMMPSAGQTAQSLSSRHQDIIPPPLRAPRSQQFFNNPAGFGSSGPVFRASHPSHPAGRLPPHYAPHSQSGFGPSGPAGPRVGLPPSVRPGPHPSSSSSHPGPSRSASRIPQQPPPSMRPTHSSSQSTPLHPSAAVASNRSLHAARSVDDLRHRTRPSAAHEAMPPLPPSMQQTRSQTRWPQEDVVPRPATTSSASRMPFPGTSQPANPASTSGHAARSHPTASFPPPQLQPRASPYPAYSGAPPPPPSRSQQGSSRSPRLPPASRSSPGNHLHPQTEFQGTDSSGAALRRSPACNTVAIDYHNSLPLQPGGTLQDALRPKESERRVPKSQAPPTQDLPTNLRAGVGAAAPPRSIQVSRRQNSGPDPSRSPVMAAGEHRFPTHTPTSSTGSMASPREGQLPFPGSPPASLPSNSTSQPSTPRPGSSSSANRSSGPSPEQSTDDAYAGTVIDDDQRRQSDRPPSLSHSASTRNSSILASPHDESAPGLPISSFEPSAPPLWEDDLPEFSEVLQPNERVGATAREEEESEEQATVKGEDWADILRKIQEGEADVDQLVPYATGPFPDNAGSQDVSTLPADPGSSGQSTMVEGTPSTSQASWGCSMEDFDDDDSDDERTWAVAPGTARPREVAEIREANERIREANASKVSPRPSLSLQIENLPMPAGPGESSSDSPPKTRQLEPTPSSEPLDDQWAVRPSVERVYDNLERFFPDHDLDKPIVDAGAPPVVNSPVSSPTPNAPQLPARAAAATPSPSTGPPPTELQRFKHKKSIRIVAQDRKRLLQRAESAVSRAVDGAATRASGLLRRKSTKLWGIRTEEVTPRQAKLAAPPSAGPSTGLSEGSCDPESGSSSFDIQLLSQSLRLKVFLYISSFVQVDEG